MKVSKSKTFAKGEDYGPFIEWVMAQVETHDYQPEGTESYGDGLCPYDPVCELKYKYVVTVTKIETAIENAENESGI
jgi:hypothetical protein